MREAAELEADTPKHAVTPAPILPASEQLGDLLMELGRADEAATAYARSRALYPNRFNTLLGAARAAAADDDPEAAKAFYSALLDMAATPCIPTKRVNEVIDMTGLASVAKKRAGGFSLGMGQRLGIASALLGDPQTLILDEPVNGLDPEGVLWVRNLAKYLASEGKTVFLSSHLMSEMAQTADHLIVIGRGLIIADAPIEQILAGAQQATVRVRTPDVTRLSQLLSGTGVTVECNENETLEVTGLDARRIAGVALENQVLVYELTPLTNSLEEAYFSLTKDEVEYHSQDFRDHDHAAVKGLQR